MSKLDQALEQIEGLKPSEQRELNEQQLDTSDADADADADAPWGTGNESDETPKADE